MDDLMAEIAAKQKEAAPRGRAPKSGGDQRQRQRELDLKRKRRREEKAAEERAYEERRRRLREEQQEKWRKRPRTAEAVAALTAAESEAGAAGSKGAATEQKSDEAAVSAGEKAAAGPPVNDTLSRLSVSEVKRLLRRAGQPVTLFGESDAARLERVRALETRAVEEGADDFSLNAGFEVTNTFLGGGGEDSEDEDGAEGPTPQAVTAGAGVATDGAPVRLERPAVITSTFSEQSLSDEKLVTKYFKFMLKEWELDLQARPEAVRHSIQGRVDTKTMKQCKEYIKPMFKLLKQKDMNPSILDSLKTMVHCCEAGDFRLAGDAYIKIAIGNAAWPIGLTMVGIHERTGREKISSKNVAHIMNNELQRKYLSSVKRLLTYGQRRRPDIQTSKKML